MATNYGIVKSSLTDQNGIGLRVLIPSDDSGRALGEPFVATDALGSSVGDLVTWAGRDPSVSALPAALLSTRYPIHAAVTRIVDDFG